MFCFFLLLGDLKNQRLFPTETAKTSPLLVSTESSTESVPLKVISIRLGSNKIIRYHNQKRTQVNGESQTGGRTLQGWGLRRRKVPLEQELEKRPFRAGQRVF